VVVDLLDWDGEADVYRVINPDLGKELVLKWGRQPVDSHELGSFLGEGGILRELDHINLVRVYDSGRHDDRPFLVMEYVHGRNLEDYARDEPVTPRRAAELMVRLAGALAMVHRKGIIHRDIKPRNILIDERGEPRLIDFGLARLRNAWSDPFSTTWGGTLSYMAPEQARREHDRTGTRSDLFGLGAVLYFLLTGRPPFVGETGEEILDRAQRGEFDSGALRTAKVPRRLERICLKALAADPADRYVTAEEFERALNRFLRGPYILAAQAAGLLGLAALGVWAASGERSRALPGGRSDAIETRISQDSASRGPLRIEELRVDLHRSNSLVPAGPLGRAVFAGHYPEDDVRVQARLNQPAFCYLIALNPDGKEQLCFPADPSVRPSPAAEIDFPPDPDSGFHLSDGVGLQAFALVASRRPLPAYNEWRAGPDKLAWAHNDAPDESVWRFNGEHFTADSPPDDRGEIRPLSAGRPATFEVACRALKDRPGIEAIQALAFPVKPGTQTSVKP
jgi:predicted Ser/Thr protein kinase